MPKFRRRDRQFWTQLIAKFEAAGGVEKHRDFAARQEVGCGAFRHWLYLLRAGERGRRGRTRRRQGPARMPAIAMPLVEVAAARLADDRFELDLGDGRRLRVPTTFEAEVLRQLLAILDEGRTR
jgi:hypothetical protein